MIAGMSESLEHGFSDGFLSEAARNLRAEAQGLYPDLVALLYAINRLAVDLQHQLEVTPDKSNKVTGAVLYARTLASTQASVLLLEHGMPTQARTVLRSSLETLFPLCAIAKEPSKADELLASHDADRRTLADRMKQWKDPELRASIPLSDAELDAILKSPAKATNIFMLAKFADMEDWYHTLYTILSFAAHAKVSDLDAHSVADADGELAGFQNEPVLAGQATVWLWTIEVQLAAMRAVARIFEATDWLQIAESRWQRLHAMAKAGGQLSAAP
ncbi:DUF5677 domain-containing protein [Variovorax sp. LjRoot178]|uniref:DUF5677 domain-containing protein n=1 Tax=Variovorax sp. LjRoot178 TaxID=3342277 RepID=UPI003ECCC701